MIDNNLLDKVLEKINKITDIEKFDETKIFIDQLPNEITIKNVNYLCY